MPTVGSKNGSGVYQTIIGLMPPHDLYVEPFAGSAAIFLHKRRARHSVLIDANPATIAALDAAIPDRRSHTAGRGGGIPSADTAAGDGAPWPETVELITGDGLAWLAHFRPAEELRVLVYCDPPYWRPARRDPKADYYGPYEWTEAQHRELLDILVGAEFDWLLSGLGCPLYRKRLPGFLVGGYQATTRGGPQWEHLWANYNRPIVLHDPRYAGRDYRHRERMSKRQRRWVQMLRRMPDRERAAMLAAISDAFPQEALK